MESRSSGDRGPVPVRDTLPSRPPEPAGGPQRDAPPAGRDDPAPSGDAPVEHRFELDGEEWLARRAGEGAYGTGGLGTARLYAIHFARADAPSRPEREALLPAADFAGLRPEELRALYERATPIELGEE
jgi:hypothetical protein